MKNKWLRYFTENHWYCLYRPAGEDTLPWQTDENRPWRRLKTGARYWCADPFLAEENGQVYVFGEMMDLKTSHGVLGVAPLNKDGDTLIRPVQDFQCHISYPNVFKYGGTWYMVPETCARKTIELYRAVSFPDRWEKVSVLAEKLHAVDTTVFRLNGRYYAFIYEPDGEHNTLSIAELDMEKGCFGQVKKVKEYTGRIGRPAGEVFVSRGMYIRPTQYGIRTYGEKVIFKAFTFDPVSWAYEEHDVAEIGPASFGKLDKRLRIQGCHTYNRVSGVEITDIKFNCFLPFKPLRSLLKKYHIGGYHFNEKN
jgi:hypothetical protein